MIDINCEEKASSSGEILKSSASSTLVSEVHPGITTSSAVPAGPTIHTAILSESTQQNAPLRTTVYLPHPSSVANSTKQSQIQSSAAPPAVASKGLLALQKLLKSNQEAAVTPQVPNPETPKTVLSLSQELINANKKIKDLESTLSEKILTITTLEAGIEECRQLYEARIKEYQEKLNSSTFDPACYVADKVEILIARHQLLLAGVSQAVIDSEMPLA